MAVEALEENSYLDVEKKRMGEKYTIVKTRIKVIERYDCIRLFQMKCVR